MGTAEPRKRGWYMKKDRLLVVDDEKQIRELYSMAFTKAGYAVTTAESAEDALELFSREQFWVVFLDLNLPDMNGIDLCRELYGQVIQCLLLGGDDGITRFDQAS